jgi:quercetin dioxygenase-like cupin family protein
VDSGANPNRPESVFVEFGVSQLFGKYHHHLFHEAIEMTRRDLAVAIVASALTASVAWAAQAPEANRLPSSVFDWTKLKVEGTAVGQRRAVFDSPSTNMDQVECHVTTVKAGLAPHAPHKHVEEELIIVKEGTLEVMQNGVTTTVGPGSVIFEASNDFHGLKNVGDRPATYFVFKWRPRDVRAQE